MSNVLKFKNKRVPPIDVGLARLINTEELKRLWDEEDEIVSYESIHYILNERGEGEYCAT